jgi:hypothetical protein
MATPQSLGFVVNRSWLLVVSYSLLVLRSRPRITPSPKKISGSLSVVLGNPNNPVVFGHSLSKQQTTTTNNHLKQQGCMVVDEERFPIAVGSAKCLEVAASSWGKIWEVKQGVTGSNVSPEVA